jgi:hypothetical protein
MSRSSEQLAARADTALGISLPDGTVLSVRIEAPNGFGTIQHLATSPGLPGVWAWSASADDSRIWHVDPTSGRTSDWSIGTSGDVLGGVGGTALAACGPIAWFGSNHTLVRLDSRTGQSTHYVVPETAPIAAVDAERPPAVRGRSGVSSMACRADGTQLVIGLADATDAFRFDTADATFTRLPLPLDNEAASTAIADDGRAAIGLLPYGDRRGAHELLVFAPERTTGTEIEVGDATSVRASGNRFVIGSGARVLDTDEHLSAAAIAPDRVAPPPIGLGNQGPQPLPDGRLAVAFADGVHLVTPSTTGANVVTVRNLGDRSCDDSGVIGQPFNTVVPTTALAPGARCGIGTATIATDVDGRLYAVLDTRVVEVPLH